MSLSFTFDKPARRLRPLLWLLLPLFVLATLFFWPLSLIVDQALRDPRLAAAYLAWQEVMRSRVEEIIRHVVDTYGLRLRLPIEEAAQLLLDVSDDTCTRAQIVSFQYRAAGAPAAGTSNPFADVANNAYYASAVKWAAEKSVTEGTTTTTFRPNAGCTRPTPFTPGA